MFIGQKFKVWLTVKWKNKQESPRNLIQKSVDGDLQRFRSKMTNFLIISHSILIPTFTSYANHIYMLWPCQSILTAS